MVTENIHAPYFPVWSTVGRQQVGNYWETYSIKAGRLVRLHTDLEYYFWVLLESDPAIITICEQPLKIRVRLEGKWVSAMLDMWYQATDGSEVFCEVKYSKEISAGVSGTRADRQLHAQLAWALKCDTRYCLVTEKTIWPQTLLISNWSYILRFLDMARRGVDFDLGQRIVRALTAHQQLTLGVIEAMFNSERVESLRASLFQQLHGGAVVADLSSRRLTANTVFQLRQ